MQVVARRVDALVLAYRVTLDGAFLTQIEERSKVAREHGRASIEVPGRVVKGMARPRARLGDVAAAPPPWAIGAGFGDVATEKAPVLVGELRYSRARKTYNLTNEPFYRLHIDLCAPGATERLDDVTGELVEEAGWTLEITWYAQTIANWGLERLLKESSAIAWQLGEVHEERLRRIDLCADVAGWKIEEADLRAIVKRSRANERSDPDEAMLDEHGFAKYPDNPACPGPRRRSGRPKLGELTGATGHATGFGETRKVTGITIGRGAMLARLYDKRLELGYAVPEKRQAEEERWSAGGWDGEDRVTRVEFQIRGVALTELGLRDPRACLETRAVGHVASPDGKIQRVVYGQRAVVNADGEPVGLVDRLDWIWQTCLAWCRIVVPRPGVKIAASRLDDDPRWTLLKAVRFGKGEGQRIRRFRERAAASEAQALGVCLSQAGRAGELRDKWSTDPLRYESADEAEAILRARVARLCADQAERITQWLIERRGDPVAACVHLAERQNATRARFFHWRGITHEHEHPEYDRNDEHPPPLASPPRGGRLLGFPRIGPNA